MLINSQEDLLSLRGSPQYGEALLRILGSARTWINRAPVGSPAQWELVSVLSTLQAMGFQSVDDLLAECAAAGVAAPPAPPAPNPPPPEPINQTVAAECQRRIYAVASQNCQMNMTAYVASGQASDAEKATFTAALGWVQAMRGAFASLAAAQDATFADDAHWPPCPASVVALAARF